MTQSYLIVDTAVILGAGFVFGWMEALYALIALYVSGLVAETTLEGGGMVRTAMIVTAEPKAVSQRIIEQLIRGVTVREGMDEFIAQNDLCCIVSSHVQKHRI